MPPQQKPPDLDEQGNPVATQPPDLDEYGYPIEEKPPSMWDNPTWKALTQPPEFVTKGVKEFGDWLTTPELDDWKATAMLKGFAAGATEGASQFLNPLDVAGLATGVGEYNAARRGLGTIAKALKWGERATSLPIAAHGFERLTDPTSSLGEKGAGIAELAGGSLGAFGPPTPVRPRPGAVAPSGGPAGPLPEPTTQGVLHFPEPRTRQRPPSSEGQGILPLDYDEPIAPIKPPINQVVAEAVAKAPEPDTMLDVEGPKGLETDLTTMEGIQKAYAEGKIDRETALRNAAKVHRKLLKKPEPEVPVQETKTVIEEGEEVVIDPNTGEIISQKPYPLTEEPTAGVTAPPGVDEVTKLMVGKQVRNIAELQKQTGLSFAKTKELWEAAKEQGGLVKGKDGYYALPEKPVGQGELPIEQSKSTLKVARGEADKTYIQSLRKDGYEFQGLDEEGNYIFGRAESASVEAPGFASKFKGATDEALAAESQIDRLGINEADDINPIRDARMESIEGVQAMYREGKISQEQALQAFEKIVRRGKTPPSNVISKMEDRGWSEDTSVSRLTPEEKEIWDSIIGVERTRETSPNVPRTGWELEREFAGPFAKSFDLEEALAKHEATHVEGSFRRPGDPKKIVDTRTGMTEQDLDDIIAIRRNKAREAQMTGGGDFNESFLRAFPQYRGQFGKVVGYNEGALSVELKNGERVIVGRENVTGLALPTNRDYENLGYAQTVMHPERFDNEGNFIGSPKEQPGLFPEAARVKGGYIKIGADIPTLGKELGQHLYKGNINKIATKELVQNSLDAIDDLGPAGIIDVEFNNTERTLTVTDNGKGMTRRELETVFTDLGRSGKRDVDTARGGFGLAKAAPLLGGEYSKTVSVAFDKRRGAKFRISFEGTPDELLSRVKPIEEMVPPETPTGTTVTVRVGDSYFSEAEEFVKDIVKHSEGFEGKIFMKGPWDSRPQELTSVVAGIKSTKPGKHVTTLSNPSANVHLSIPPDAVYGKVSEIKVHLKNKGMYQSTIRIGMPNAMPDIPNQVVANIDAIVPETHPDYPFTANREELRGATESQVKKYIEEEIIEPAKKKYSDGVQELYDGMEVIKGKTGRDIAFYDTGGKYTKLEFYQAINTPTIKRLAEQIDTILTQALSSMNNPAWTKKLERVGIIFDDSLRGVHIPNPASGGSKSTILINPLQLMATRTPDEFAAGLIHTTLHEMAHLEPGWIAHGDSFCIRLGDIYEKFGASKANYQQQLARQIVTGGSGSYTPEVQKLLQGYIESRGRSAVKDDVLTRTGTQQRFGASGTGEFSPGGKSDGKGTLRDIPVGRTIIVNPKHASPEVVKKLWQEGFRFVDESSSGGLRFRKEAQTGAAPILEEEVGSQRPTRQAIRGQLGPIQDAQKSNAIAEAFNFPRGVMASWDLSAPLRQGLPMIHKKEFWTSLEPMMKSWASEDGFQASQDAIANRALFKKRVDVTGKELPSFADDAGLKLTDLVDLSKREEAIMSTWAEKVPLVRRSNRAYTAFLNNLRADVFESLINDAGILGGDPKKNLPLARAIADFVNTATGRGKLSIDIPKGLQSSFGDRTELSLESSAVILNTTLFAPRLIASRIKMLNPATYLMAPPQVRKEYVKSLLALSAFGSTILGLAKMGGAEVSMDPTSSDFMKAKIGDKVRIDPWAGFQQYAVLFSRLVSGKVTSSTSGKEYDLWNKKGPFDPTHADIMARFVRGKTNPVFNFAWGIADAQREMSGKPMQFSTPNPFENSIAQRFIPIFVQDVYQIGKESPELLPLLAPAAGLGMGVQVYDNPR